MASNYRPILTLSVFNEVFEKLFHLRLSEFLTNIISLLHSLISKEMQYYFGSFLFDFAMIRNVSSFYYNYNYIYIYRLEMTWQE